MPPPDTADAPALPSDDADDLTWLLFQQRNVITWSQARHHMSEATIRHRLRSGRWRRVHHRIYLTHNGPVERTQRLWIAVLAAGEGAVLAGATALGEYGLTRYRGAGIHVLVPAASHPQKMPPGVVVHRTTVLPAEDIHRVARPPRTMPARSVVDAAGWAGSVEDACAMVAAAFGRQLVTEADIGAALDRLPRARRRAVITAAAADAAGGAHSLSELRYVRLNRRHGLPEPTRQKVRLDRAGRRRYLDAYYDQWHVHVEIDGMQHNDPRQQWADMKRQNDIWAPGDRLLRFPSFAVRHLPDEVFAQVRQALLEAGWKP